MTTLAERIAVVETKVDTIALQLNGLNGKLDHVLEYVSDQRASTAERRRIVGASRSFVVTAVTIASSVVGVVVLLLR